MQIDDNELQDLFVDFFFEDDVNNCVPLDAQHSSDVKSLSESASEDNSSDDLKLPVGKANLKRRRSHLRDNEGGWLVPRIHLPRILKSDIRRSFGIMFTNVYNSGDLKFIASFVEKFVSHDYQFTNIAGGKRQDLRSTKDVLSSYWFSRTQVSPDLHFHFEATRIKVRSDGSAVLYGAFATRGTKVVDRSAFTHTLVESVREDDSTATDSSHAVYFYDDKQLEDALRAANENKLIATPNNICGQPQLFHFKKAGELTMSINADGQIDSVCMDALQSIMYFEI